MTERLLANSMPAAVADGNGGFPELMTEEELVLFLRIPEISKAEDHHHVIEHLKRMRGLPCLHICRQPLYPRTAILEWIAKETAQGARK